MLSFFKSKAYLKDLIPENHIDIHSHLLPEIDDGAQNIEDTIYLVTELKKIGFQQCITTPHVMKNVWENTYASITAKLEKTNIDLEHNKLTMPLKAAAEYLLDANFVELFKHEPLLTLKDNYVLVELSYLSPPIQLYDILFELQIEGYKPVLAHPERYSFYFHNFSEYRKLKNLGCLFQLNLLSTIGYYGGEVAMIAEKLLKKGLIDFVGSDVHHKNHVDGFSKKILTNDALPIREAIDNNQIFRF